MAEQNKDKQYTSAELVQAKANIIAKENGLVYSNPVSDISDDDIKKHLLKARSEGRERTKNFLADKEQLGFNFDAPLQEDKPKVTESVITVKSDPVIDEIIFVPEKPVTQPKDSFDSNSEQLDATREVWNKITTDTAKIADEREQKMKETTEWIPETSKAFVEQTNELGALFKNGFVDKFENGVISGDNFTIYETSNDFVASNPVETRHIFARHDEKGVTQFISINGVNKDEIRASNPELDGWVVVKQNVRESDFDKDFTESNFKLAEKIETMIHAKMLNKENVKENVKDLEKEIKDVKAIENLGIVSEDFDNDSDVTESKKTSKIKNKP